MCGDQEIQRPDREAPLLEVGTDLPVVTRGGIVEIHDGKEADEFLDLPRPIRIGHALGKARPQFRGDDRGEAAVCRRWRRRRCDAAAKNINADGGIEEKEGQPRSPVEIALLLRTKPCRRGKPPALRVLVVEMAGELGQRSMRGLRLRLQHDLLATPLDTDLGPLEAERLRQAHGLAPTVPEQLCTGHIYTM